MAVVSRTSALNMHTLYDDLMNLCSYDDAFYYKDVRLRAINYRIFNCRLCSYGRFKTGTAALNCGGTMFNVTNPKSVQLVSLPMEKIFDYEEGFGQKEYHERGRLGDKMEKLDGSFMSTFLHGRVPKDQVLRLKAKQTLTSNQVLDAMRLLIGDLHSEIDQLVRRHYTINLEYTSPSNRVFVSYSQPQLTVLSIRCHADGRTLFGTRLKQFLLENQLLTIAAHLVPFESIPAGVTHKQLLEDVYRETQGEGYVVEIIHPDRPPYLVKLKTQKYVLIYGDGATENSDRALFEATINEHTDDLTGLFKDDAETLRRIEAMKQNVRPKYEQMIELIERFFHANKHLCKKDFTRLITANEDMKVYLPLLTRLYAGDGNDYKAFALRHAKDLFHIAGHGCQQASDND